MFSCQNFGPGAETSLAQAILTKLTVNGLARTRWDSVIQCDVKTVGPKGQGGLNDNHWLSGQGDVFENVDPAHAQNLGHILRRLELGGLTRTAPSRSLRGLRLPF